MFSAKTICSTYYRLYRAALDYNSHLRNTNLRSYTTASQFNRQLRNDNYSLQFFPCIWVIRCLLPSFRTVDFAVQKLLNTEKFLQVPLVYSYFRTGKYRGLQITDNEHSECRYLQQTAACLSADVESRRHSVPSTALQVSLGFNLVLSFWLGLARFSCSTFTS